MLATVRQFFEQRGIVEVDTPLLSHSAPIDTHIEVMTVNFADGQKGYLHTSPEYAIKRLLAGCPIDLYQLSHVFREGEVGPLHNPEFTMIEWYRMEFSLGQLLDETLELIRIFLGDIACRTMTYRDLFLECVGVDPFTAAAHELYEKAQELNVEGSPDWDVDTWLYFFMSFFIEPKMKGLVAVHSFPSTQAALSRVRNEGPYQVADRFEIFCSGIELANGFHELTDAAQQRQRFEAACEKRERLGRPHLPIDEKFLQALEKGLPDCCGVAVGFDRLLMLKEKAATLKEVLPLSWDAL